MKKANRLTEKRSERKKVFLKSGAYLIVTDAEKTEKNYFEGIKNIIPDSLKNDLQIKIYSNKPLAKIIDFAAEQRNKDERFRDIWLVFDRDEVKNFYEEWINFIGIEVFVRIQSIFLEKNRLFSRNC